MAKNSEENLIWKENSRKTVLQTPIFSVSQSECTSASGFNGTYTLVEPPDWVTIIPVSCKQGRKHFLMVRQWRHGERAVSTEFPGGVIDAGETPEQAARRELLEETGCKAGKLTYLGSVNPNPAFMTNRSHFFVAEDLTETGTQDLDEDEFLNVHALAAEEVFANMGHGDYCHALMSVAMLFYLQKFPV